MSYTSDIEFVLNNMDWIDIDYNDIIKTKIQFNYLVDNLNHDNLISDKSASHMYLSMNAKNKKSYIVCGSYKWRIDN